MSNKSKMPQIGEAVFCIIYLIFGYIAGIVMVIQASGSRLNLILGLMTLVLAGGDPFHLVPRIINAFKDKYDSYEFYADLGLMVSSITMTLFYVLFYNACRLISLFNEPGSITDALPNISADYNLPYSCYRESFMRSSFDGGEYPPTFFNQYNESVYIAFTMKFS